MDIRLGYRSYLKWRSVDGKVKTGNLGQATGFKFGHPFPSGIDNPRIEITPVPRFLLHLGAGGRESRQFD